jgi:hypothetical protein
MDYTLVEKSIDDYFADWEGHVFGFGYGSGEEHTLAALKRFMDHCPMDTAYDYRILEEALTPTVTWLLINTLGHASIIEYGTSPRYAWLRPKGKALKAYIDSKTVEQLCEQTSRDQNYSPCYPDACNCGPDGYEKGRVCQNPFFLDTLRHR